jgi:hypothetical protein
MTLDITFVFEGTKRTKRPRKFCMLGDLQDAMELCLEWEAEKPGRKAYAYCPGEFTATRVYRLIEHWLPKKREQMANLVHMGD